MQLIRLQDFFKQNPGVKRNTLDRIQEADPQAPKKIYLRPNLPMIDLDAWKEFIKFRSENPLPVKPVAVPGFGKKRGRKPKALQQAA